MNKITAKVNKQRPSWHGSPQQLVDMLCSDADWKFEEVRQDKATDHSRS